VSVASEQEFRESQRREHAEREAFWTVVRSFEPLRASGPNPPVNPEWFYLPGAVLKLPYPKDLFESDSFEDHYTLTFKDDARRLKLNMEFEYPTSKEGEGLLEGLAKSITAMFTSLQIERSGSRWVDAIKGDEVILLDPDAGKLLCGLKASTKRSPEYRPRLVLELWGPLKQKDEAIEVWDAVLDTIFALQRSKP
jgi:hypothetical protein